MIFKIIKALLPPIFILITIFIVTVVMAGYSGTKKQVGAQNTISVPVLVLKFFPLDPNDPSRIDTTITNSNLPAGITLIQLRERVNRYNQQISFALEKASIYHGYKNPQATPLLDYSIYEEREFLEPVPVEPGTGTRPADHVKILTQKGFNICDYVENRGVKEVWLWMYHSSTTYPVESYQRGPYGGFGTGFMNLPLCLKTYTVYDYNYGRGLGEALEDHGHHQERLFQEIAFGLSYQYRGERVSPFACGDIHCPPNIMSTCPTGSYNWFSETIVPSYCENWQGQTVTALNYISCHSWARLGRKFWEEINDNFWWSHAHLTSWDEAEIRCNTDDGGVSYKLWWMQNLPPNFWTYIGEFDRAKSQNIPFLPVPSPQPNYGDIDGDGKIDIVDFRFLIRDFIQVTLLPTDLNQNGKVDIFDLNIHTESFGK